MLALLASGAIGQVPADRSNSIFPPLETPRPSVAPEGGGPALPDARPTLTETEFKALISQLPSYAKEKGPLAITARPVDVTVDGMRLRGRFARPVATTPTAALVLVHGLMGADEAFLGEANRMAEKGAAALALDCYGGALPVDRGAASRLARALETTATLKCLAAAGDWTRAEAGMADGRPVGVVGFGLGADWALAAAAGPHPPAAVGLFYGGIAGPAAARLDRIAAPVIGFFARRDRYLIPERVQAFENNLTAAGIENRIFLFAVDPGFNFNNADTQSQSYADTARERTVQWVARFGK
jgi:carboxymethylenebutenolidase